MTDNRNNHPLDPMEDQVLDQYLASLGRYAPSPAFDDRVMARVRINAPVPAPAPSFAPPAVRRRRWPVLAYSLSGAAAVSSTALTAWVAANFQALAASASASLIAVGGPAGEGGAPPPGPGAGTEPGAGCTQDAASSRGHRGGSRGP